MSMKRAENVARSCYYQPSDGFELLPLHQGSFFWDGDWDEKQEKDLKDIRESNDLKVAISGPTGSFSQGALLV
jgi:hypothetical protein